MNKRIKNFAANIAAGAAKEDAAIAAKGGSVSARFAQLDPHATAPAANANHAIETHLVALEREGRATRRRVSLPLSSLDDNPLNSRKFYSEEKVTARAMSIAQRGQFVPALAAPNENAPGRYFLIDGHYRKRANLRLDRTEMDCEVIEGLSKADFYLIARTLNKEREEETVLDIAFGLKKLLDEQLAGTEEELAELVGENRSKVTKLLSIAELPQAVLDVMQRAPDYFGMTVGYELTQYLKAMGEDKTVAFAEKIAKEQTPLKKVEELRKQAQSGKKAPKAMSRQHKIRAGDAEIGILKEWDSGRVVLELKLSDPTLRDKHLSALRRQFGLEDA